MEEAVAVNVETAAVLDAVCSSGVCRGTVGQSRTLRSRSVSVVQEEGKVGRIGEELTSAFVLSIRQGAVAKSSPGKTDAPESTRSAAALSIQRQSSRANLLFYQYGRRLLPSWIVLPAKRKCSTQQPNSSDVL